MTQHARQKRFSTLKSWCYGKTLVPSLKTNKQMRSDWLAPWSKANHLCMFYWYPADTASSTHHCDPVCGFCSRNFLTPPPHSAMLPRLISGHRRSATMAAVILLTVGGGRGEAYWLPVSLLSSTNHWNQQDLHSNWPQSALKSLDMGAGYATAEGCLWFPCWKDNIHMQTDDTIQLCILVLLQALLARCFKIRHPD